MLSKEYISGFCDADGGWSGKQIVITNTEINQLKEINKSLNEHGIETYLGIYDNTTNSKHAPQIGRIRIMGFKNLLKFATDIGFKFERKQNKLISYLLTQTVEGKRYNLKEHNEIVKLRNQGMSYRKIEEHFNYRIPFVTIAQRFKARFQRNEIWPLEADIIKRLELI